ncbi:MAG TPA: O-methyltransferase [Bacteroidales bacterium]|nr:O-methyltransferase [Bacteroidales bacterium]
MKHDKGRQGTFLTLPEIEAYAESCTTPESQLLYELNRKTHLEVLMPRMLSGHLQGAFLSMLVRMKHPMIIVEIGTFTGYASLAMALAMPAEAKLITIEKNPEVAEIAKAYFAKANLQKRISLRVGDAREAILHLEPNIDLLFIDADKRNTLKYYQLLLPKVNPGGIIVVDNVLWDGKVIDNQYNNDKDALALHTFNRYVQQDESVENLLLPFRDGIMLIRKK